MTTIHEVGHIVCGIACGGSLRSANLIPWHLPYSFFDPDPFPLITLWGGPVFGVAVPTAIAWWTRQSWAWFIAYFCMLANGTYLAVAWGTGDRFLDTARLLSNGTHPLLIAIYCIACIGWGYAGFRQQCVRMLFLNPLVKDVSSNKTD